MNDNVITLKLTPLPMMYNLVNFIIFGLIITFIINWSCGIIAAGICFLVAFRDRNNIKDFIIDPDKDILSFSSFYQYSIWKSIVCVIYPLFRMNATMRQPPGFLIPIHTLWGSGKITLKRVAGSLLETQGWGTLLHIHPSHTC